MKICGPWFWLHPSYLNDFEANRRSVLILSKNKNKPFPVNVKARLNVGCLQRNCSERHTHLVSFAGNLRSSFHFLKNITFIVLAMRVFDSLNLHQFMTLYLRCSMSCLRPAKKLPSCDEHQMSEQSPNGLNLTSLRGTIVSSTLGFLTGLDKGERGSSYIYLEELR